jgi:hypothetical protein
VVAAEVVRMDQPIEFVVDGRRIFVNATTAWPFASVTQAARRLNEAVRRESQTHNALSWTRRRTL